MNRTLCLWRKRRNLNTYVRAKASGLAQVPHAPLEIFVEVSNRCNINCVMCARPEEVGRETGEITLSHIEKISSLFPEALMLHAYGFGEPLMNPHFFDLLERAKRASIFVDFFTNGMAFNAARCQHAVDLGVDRITFSVDAGTPATFEAIRRGARFDTVMGHMKALFEARQRAHAQTPRMDINFIATTPNLHELPLLVDLAADRGVTQISVKPLVTYAYKPELDALRRIYVPEEDDPILDQARAKATARGLHLDCSLYLATRSVQAASPSPCPSSEVSATLPAKPRCFQPWKTLYVTWKGEIKTCCFAVSPILGTLETSSGDAIWDGTEYRLLREKIAAGRYPEDCSHCLKFGLMPTQDDAEDVFGLLAGSLGPAGRSVLKAFKRK